MTSTSSATPALIPDLLQFASIPPDFMVKLEELRDRAQPEDWEDPDANDGRLYILSSYIRFTFRRLVEEDKVAFAEDPQSSKKIAAFNTGLFTPNFEAIFAYLVENHLPGKQPWILREWLPASDRRISSFGAQEPRPARYFDSPADLIFDPDMDVKPNLDHILDDHSERFPPEIKRPHQRRLLLDGAIREAVKRVQMNWKTAVPQYYFGKGAQQPGRIQLLLPVCLVEPGRTDLALVLDKFEDHYRANTALPLNYAYKNARLISRPDSEWLVVEAQETAPGAEAQP